MARCVREARAGSQPAFARLHRRFLPLVHAILLGRHPPALADELAQECFATAFARLAQLQEDGRFGAWIATIARRARPHAMRAHDGEGALAQIAGAAAPPEDAVEAARVLRAIAALPEAYRETLLLRLAEGLSGPEIAALTGMTHASVRVNLHRGMARLRAALGVVEHLPEDGHD
ncbi:sigma-70 family RNA polymerase sigma factor [Luteimonas sp. SJ-92]|uniref:Sigma-70 family RNA polymerase sigma factor n=1 Tax=Luteimonas salinisoli TaxID=2752307 RepID=A0A853JC73_9GAMM|nr:sigma-70 family RNA polymerase sigma factor [Luteimonas salinisoli]